MGIDAEDVNEEALDDLAAGSRQAGRPLRSDRCRRARWRAIITPTAATDGESGGASKRGRGASGEERSPADALAFPARPVVRFFHTGPPSGRPGRNEPFR